MNLKRKQPIYAQLTLDAIRDAMELDDGARFRRHLGEVLPQMRDVYSQEKGGPRAHLGASVAGKDCARAIWYGFHWASERAFNARMLRLFARGHLEEARFIALLLMINVEVFHQDSAGNQYRIRVDENAHIGGSTDGILRGIPDLPEGALAVAEFKTHNRKSFEKLDAYAYNAGIPQTHIVQMNIYMHKFQIEHALYLAVNKDDDDLFAVIVPYDSEVAERALSRADAIVKSKVAPQKLNDSPAYYQCKWCDFRMVCHENLAPDTNCRTCRFAEARPDGTFHCLQFDLTLSYEAQIAGCAAHERLF